MRRATAQSADMWDLRNIFGAGLIGSRVGSCLDLFPGAAIKLVSNLKRIHIILQAGVHHVPRAAAARWPPWCPADLRFS